MHLDSNICQDFPPTSQWKASSERLKPVTRTVKFVLGQICFHAGSEDQKGDVSRYPCFAIPKAPTLGTVDCTGLE